MHHSSASTAYGLAIGALFLSACAATSEPATSSTPAGGDTTVFDDSRDAFSYSARNLGPSERDTFLAGKSLFQRAWVRAPASTEGGDGLGPTYTATSCGACHVRAGRGAVPDGPRDRAMGLVVRLDWKEGSRGTGLLEPAYGAVLQPYAIDGIPNEGNVEISYSRTTYDFADGEHVELRRPTATVRELAFGPLRSDTELDLRVAPQLVGLGLLEAIPELDVRKRADPDDRDGDGIRGRVSELPGPDKPIGRFGWRASFATVEDVVAAALLEDIGLTSSHRPSENCPAPQRSCREAQSGGAPEISDDKLARVAFFARTLAVPARRRDGDSQTARGEALFSGIGCASCHVPTGVTGESSIPALSRQTIASYTDLLMHRLETGDGSRGESDIRTPPLWGLGLHTVVNGHAFLLHDGRARSPQEAILWHGGEGARSRSAYSALDAADRASLIRFLESL